MNRIERLRKGIDVDRYPLCIEKVRLLTESFKSTENEPMILRRAKALAHVLDNITIFIEDDQLIAGNAASKPMGLEFDFYAGLWSEEEIEGLREAGYAISDDDEKELLSIREYWTVFDPISRIGRKLDDRLWPFTRSGMILPPWKDKQSGPGGGYAESGMGLGPGFFILTPDFEKVLRIGLRGIIEEAEIELSRLEEIHAGVPEKIAFLKSVIIGQSAVIRFAGRLSELADRMALSETDPERKNELNQIAATCRHVPEYPARTFYEALQCFWFVFLMTTPSPTASMGRFDQYMYPFYKKDIASGAITRDYVLELLQSLRIKDMHINRISGRLARQKNAGMAKWHNMTIAGIIPQTGEDATNELSYLVLDAIKLCPVPHHTVTVRVNESTPQELLIKALEVVKTGIGMPAFVGDRSYIEYLLSEGLSLENARNYAMGGCIDPTVPGKSRIAVYFMFIVTKVFEVTMNNGFDPRLGIQIGLETGEFETFETFDDFMEAFKRQLKYFMTLHAERNNIDLQIYRDLFPDPVRSSLMYQGVQDGRPLLERAFPLENAAVLNPVGMINVIDSLIAVKKLVFDDQSVGKKELLEALKRNWEGPDGQRLRKLFLAAPKYGNNDSEADTVAGELYRYFANTAVEFKTYLGGTHKPTGVSVSAQWPGGSLTGATPDGRYAGECLADGTVSPMRGRDTRGPTAVILSAMKIDQVPYQASLLNMKLHPSALRTREDLVKLSILIRTYFSRNGKHIQFNVVDRNTLLSAQQAPENYRDLIVRIAGYSAYFVQLGKPMQDEIIGRTEHLTEG
jgi:pyruvate formate-lyase/glycerol dehydratase family glycyl radical enzyme